MPLDISSNSAEILITAIYGTAATVIGVVGIYQGRRAWMTWYAHHHRQGSHAADIELGQPASPPTAPPSGSTERGATIDSSHITYEEHPVAVSVLTQVAEGDHVIDDQNHARTPSPRREASSSQSPSSLPHIMVERHEVAA